MRAAFQMACSEAAKSLPKEDLDALVRQALAEAEKLKLKDNTVILDDDRGLKIVVRWAQREVWVMAVQEAEEAVLTLSGNGHVY